MDKDYVWSLIFLLKGQREYFYNFVNTQVEGWENIIRKLAHTVQDF